MFCTASPPTTCADTAIVTSRPTITPPPTWWRICAACWMPWASKNLSWWATASARTLRCTSACCTPSAYPSWWRWRRRSSRKLRAAETAPAVRLTASAAARAAVPFTPGMTAAASANRLPVSSTVRVPGGVGSLRRVHRQIRQLGEGDQLAPGGLGPAEQDAELGVHGDLDAVIGPFGGTGSEHITARRGRDRDRVAAGGGHRPQHFQGVPAEQAGRAEQLGHRRIGAVHLDRERRGPSPFRRPP